MIPIPLWGCGKLAYVFSVQQYFSCGLGFQTDEDS